MKYLVLVIALGFAGCDSAKRAIKAKEQFDIIGHAWALEHPCDFSEGRIDTLEVIEFDTTTVDYYRRLWEGAVTQLGTDTSYESISKAYYTFIDSLLKHPVTKTVTRTIIDTVIDKRTCEAKDAIIIQDGKDISSLSGALEQAEKDAKGKVSKWWMWVALGMGAAGIGLTVYKLKV